MNAGDFEVTSFTIFKARASLGIRDQYELFIGRPMLNSVVVSLGAGESNIQPARGGYNFRYVVTMIEVNR